jgi:hypothetical protein
MRRSYVFILFAFCLALSCTAQWSFTAVNTVQTIDFESTVPNVNEGEYNGSGFSTTPPAGRLDADAWAVTGMSFGNKPFGTQLIIDDYARGNVESPGNMTQAGGIYAWTGGIAGNSSLGINPSGADWTPGTITLRITNNTGSPIVAFDVYYTLYVRNDFDRGNSFNFSFSTDDITYTSVASMNYTSPDANTFATNQGLIAPVLRSLQGQPITLPIGGSLYIRWSGDDVSGGGNRDEFMLDDIAVVLLDVLPVEFLGLSATPTPQGVELNWATASESNNNYFTVERLAEGSWQTVGEVAGAGTSTAQTNYQYTDAQPVYTLGKTAYRIRQTDYDGTYSFSNTVEIFQPATEELIRVYPNPAQHTLYVQAPAGARVTLHDVNGREVLNSTPENGQVSLQGVEPGVYTCRVQTVSNVYTIRLVVQP